MGYSTLGKPYSLMSSSVASSSTSTRAKWRLGNCAKGITALFGSTTPGDRFMEASNCRKSATRSAATGASTMKLDCGVMTLELQREIDRSLLLPEHNAQIHSGADLANLIANSFVDYLSFRVVNHYAFLAVKPAVPLVDLGDDGID